VDGVAKTAQRRDPALSGAMIISPAIRQPIARRRFLAAMAAMAAMAGARAVRAGEPSDPAAIVRNFYAVLLAVMKDGAKLGLAGRRDRLAPAIRLAFDFPLMTRLMVGVQWQGLAPAQQQQIIDAFSTFSIATYASRFDDYSGESFNVEPTPQLATNGDSIVHSQLVKSDGDKVSGRSSTCTSAARSASWRRGGRNSRR
jgi:phospholipid transport system substrate-binding protein